MCEIAIPLQKYGIETIFIPLPTGWQKKTLDVAIKEARQFMGKASKRRQDECIGNYFIEDIRHKLSRLELT